MVNALCFTRHSACIPFCALVTRRREIAHCALGGYASGAVTLVVTWIAQMVSEGTVSSSIGRSSIGGESKKNIVVVVVFLDQAIHVAGRMFAEVGDEHMDQVRRDVVEGVTDDFGVLDDAAAGGVVDECCRRESGTVTGCAVRKVVDSGPFRTDLEYSGQDHHGDAVLLSG